jgi:predicted DNA-binding helix-hairpin-helix protein
MEAPDPDLMRRLSQMKNLERDILDPMGWIDRLTRETSGGAVGQATQLVVGAADESDADILKRIGQLYGEWNVKRVYYSPFRPVLHTPLEDHAATPAQRGYRLYQMDWLKRVYGFSNEELAIAFDDRGFLPMSQDPKTVIALNSLDAFPVDLARASMSQLLRVPGIGPKAAERIERNRRGHRLDNWRDLQALGVVRKWAWPFVVFPGHRPSPGRQLMMDLFGVEQELEQRQSRRAPAASSASRPTTAAASAPCGIANSCAGCGLFGTPGHPGYSPVAWGRSAARKLQPAGVN